MVSFEFYVWTIQPAIEVKTERVGLSCSGNAPVRHAESTARQKTTIPAKVIHKQRVATNYLFDAAFLNWKRYPTLTPAPGIISPSKRKYEGPSTGLSS